MFCQRLYLMPIWLHPCIGSYMCPLQHAISSVWSCCEYSWMIAWMYACSVSSVRSYTLQLHGLLCPWDYPSKKYWSRLSGPQWVSWQMSTPFCLPELSMIREGLFFAISITLLAALMFCLYQSYWLLSVFHQDTFFCFFFFWGHS